MAITTGVLVTLTTSALDQESVAEVYPILTVEETATTPAVIESYTAPGVALEEPRVDMSRSKRSHEDASTTVTPAAEKVVVLVDEDAAPTTLTPVVEDLIGRGSHHICH